MASEVEPLPIQMLHDRILVSTESEGERKSGGGILIPATVKMGHRLSWAQVVAAGPNVRSVKVGDRVLFDPSEQAEVELQASVYILLRERDIHAIAATRLEDGHQGLYL